jgi:hypothetical protein
VDAPLAAIPTLDWPQPQPTSVLAKEAGFSKFEKLAVQHPFNPFFALSP